MFPETVTTPLPTTGFSNLVTRLAMEATSELKRSASVSRPFAHSPLPPQWTDKEWEVRGKIFLNQCYKQGSALPPESMARRYIQSTRAVSACSSPEQRAPYQVHTSSPHKPILKS